MFDDMEWVETYIDDILVFGRSQAEHDERLKQVLERCRAQNFRLNRKKCKFSQSSVEFLGHVISGEGLKAKNDKVEAIRNMVTPQSKQDVQRFLGIVTYLSKFCPNLAEHTAPLRDMCRAKAEFM